MPELEGWESFYVIVGSSGAALTGLMFVVIALIADLDDPPSSGVAVAAFGTPTIAHFCAALAVSALLSAPWRTLTSVAIAAGICGVAGLVYAVRVIRHARRQTEYRPDFEDWLWYSVFPIATYATIVIAAVVLPSAPRPSLFAIGAAVLALVLIGIHNSWDSVTYLALVRRQDQGQSKS
jgi:uncharacterized membrane protein YadS